MKKVALFATVAAAAIISSCGPTAPKAEFKTDQDTLAYAFGVANTEGLKPYLAMQMQMDTTDVYMAEFFKGLVESVKGGDDKKQAAYLAGLQIGKQVAQMKEGLNREIFGENDTVNSISMDNLLAGFIDGTSAKGAIFTSQEANEIIQAKMEVIRSSRMEAEFGEIKAEGEAYLAGIAQEEGVQELQDGIYYKVLTEGKGEIPTASSRVKVNYEGTLVDGTVFDSSYKRNEPTTFACNQVIQGWTKALTNMPVGSKWIIYIPYDQAYGTQNMGQIKPFSALTFTVELLSIEE